MVTLHDVRWGEYLDYEGPWFPGDVPYVMPSNPTEADRAIAVLGSTESGHLDAVNMYDRCIVSTGLIQFCEAVQQSTSALLGAIVTASGGSVVDVPILAHQLAACGASFAKNANGRWRFLLDSFGEVNTLAYQQTLFLQNSTGKKGSWNDDSKAYAKQWVVTLATVLEGETAQKVQVDFTLARLMGFVLPEALAQVFRTQPGQAPPAPVDEWEAALRAAYLSFAANNPSIANRMVEQFFANTMSLKSKDICIGLLKQLTFGPKITIYPARYNAIRPVLETLFHIDLPDFAQELQMWQLDANIDPNAPSDQRLDSVLAVQEALVSLGFDVGPAGTDGKMGAKTRSAIMQFQMANHLEADGLVGAATRAAMLAALEKLDP